MSIKIIIIINIIKKANNKILIIDNYIDDSVLKMLSKKKDDVKVVILTSNKSNIENIDIQKFNKEYAYELDRSVPKIGRYLGKAEDLVFLTVTATEPVLANNYRTLQ